MTDDDLLGEALRGLLTLDWPLSSPQTYALKGAFQRARQHADQEWRRRALIAWARSDPAAAADLQAALQTITGA